MRGSLRTRVSTVIGVVTWLLIGSSCQTPGRSGFHTFTEKKDWGGYAEVARQKRAIFQPDERHRPTRFIELADRIDYCEAYGASVNAAIRVDSGED
jgi:hypothetical protein